MVSAWRNFKNISSRPLFTIIFRPEMLKFHPYPILTRQRQLDLLKQFNNFRFKIRGSNVHPIIYVFNILYISDFFFQLFCKKQLWHRWLLWMGQRRNGGGNAQNHNPRFFRLKSRLENHDTYCGYIQFGNNNC